MRFAFVFCLLFQVRKVLPAMGVGKGSANGRCRSVNNLVTLFAPHSNTELRPWHAGKTLLICQTVFLCAPTYRVFPDCFYDSVPNCGNKFKCQAKPKDSSKGLKASLNAPQTECGTERERERATSTAIATATQR